jgi:carbamoyltransferase
LTTIVGINEGINASVVLLTDGEIVFAVQEERLNKQKEYVGFPHQALEFTLTQCGLTARDVDTICLSNVVSPVSSREAFLAAYTSAAERSLDDVVAAAPLADRSNHNFSELVQRLLHDARSRGRDELAITSVGSKGEIAGLEGNRDVVRYLAEHGFADTLVRRYHHHLCHAASAYFGRRRDPETPHLVLTCDGGGDDSIAQVYRVVGGRFELLASTPPGHSVGNLYSHATHFMGMRPHEHEYKLMGLAPYADPNYCLPVVETLRSYLDLDPAAPMTFRRKIPESTSAVEPRMAADFKRIRFDSLAGGLQLFCEELLVRWVGECVRRTGIRSVVTAGGVFMNVKANKRIAELPEVEFFDVFPSCGDETLPFGAVWQAWAESGRAGGRCNPTTGLRDLYLGPEGDFDIDEARRRYSDRVSLRRLADPEATAAELMAGGVVVARCSGRMEFGARALGNRSIQCDPSAPTMIRRINQMIKQRDFWMPFAPAINGEYARDYLHIPATLPDDISPFMMHTFDTTARRGEIAAGIHPYDDTARAQIVVQATNPALHRLIELFGQRTGINAVLNTSFNLHGYPIVLGACDAIEVMLNSGLTKLIVGEFLIEEYGA